MLKMNLKRDLGVVSGKHMSFKGLTHPPIKALHCMLRFDHTGDMVKETPIMWGEY